MRLGLHWQPFDLALAAPLVTAQGRLRRKRGWLLRLELQSRRDGASGAWADQGWGEASPLPLAAEPEASGRELARLAEAISALGPEIEHPELEACLPSLPATLAFALGAALGEIQGVVGGAVGGWLPPPASAQLLPAGPAALMALERTLGDHPLSWQGQDGGGPLTLKWKVAVSDDLQERQLLEQLLERLPPGARLRLDANGGWGRGTAAAWAARLAGDPRLAWLEQPLDPADHAGLLALAAGPPAVPVALDESLVQDPVRGRSWRGWQVRRPSQEGDPRPLLAQLRGGVPRLMLSTGFETGIGRRWLHHLAALQILGPTPAAPGLAPGWGPSGDLASHDPERVWAAAAESRAEPPESGSTVPPPR
ncbi:o-succinylbenzoate synthase [Synechococcus sp. BSF8S]|uniref:enolase C-terminal domain-like protein n=1 Tax=unclassified Synechococcus TaxID=2626047 RepID=UPI001626B965|nr:o-succinylbenzoate synthase [Synechococcus sp. BSF8S]MBC1262743.1 o-succinylbenzoate synthase [Synechococcus sp. BSA11S]